LLYDFVEAKEELIQLLTGEHLLEVVEVNRGCKRGRFPWERNNYIPTQASITEATEPT